MTAPPDDPDAAWLVPLDAIRREFRRGDQGFGLFPLELVDVTRGRTVYRLPISDRVGGGVAGGVHGGVIATIADIAVVAAVLSACKADDEMRGTAELNLSYLRPAVGRALLATATVLKMGRSLAVADVDIENDDGLLVAKGRVTYALARRGDRAG